MITYGGGAFGFEVLFRLHGSAIFKSMTPAWLSCGIYLLLYFHTNIGGDGNNQNSDRGGMAEQLLDHPYPIGALVSAFSFLLVFKANFAYHRYWEAFTAIHQMHSKWLDFATEVASFHYQSERYQSYKPPAFGSYCDPAPMMMSWSDHVSKNPSSMAQAAAAAAADSSSPPTPSSHVMSVVSRERERLSEPMTKEELQDHIEEMVDQATINGDVAAVSSLRCRFFRRKRQTKKQAEEPPSSSSQMSRRKSERTRIINQRNHSKNINGSNNDSFDDNVRNNAANSTRSGMLGKGKGKKLKRQPTLYNEPGAHSNGTNNSSFTAVARKTWREGLQSIAPQGAPQGASGDNGYEDDARYLRKKPPQLPSNALFLEEIAHLLSLLSAVAMSTLRNDLENAESPLIEFYPNEPWPHVDPDDYMADVRQEWASTSAILGDWRIGLPSSVRYMLGLSRTDANRTLYNAARPFRVIGNVSDSEIELLQLARGPLAKVSLCSLWLQEFLSREYLQGSTGKVAPPIISRLYQYVSEGMTGYNQARKIAYIPFPFPHAQITTLFVLVIMAFIPLLMLTFVRSLVLGLLLNLLTALCFVGLHEVARELENPFQNVPNDLPLNNYQAQFNESLMVMFYGFHPDGHNWIPPSQNEDRKEDNRAGNAGFHKKDEDVKVLQDGEQGAPSAEARNHKQKSTPFQIPEIILENAMEDDDGTESALSSESNEVPIFF